MAYANVIYNHSPRASVSASEVEDGTYFKGEIEGNFSLFLRVGAKIVDLEQTETIYSVRGTTVVNYTLLDSIEITVS